MQKEDGSRIILPVTDQPGIQSDDEFERAVNEITTQELKVTTLAILKKVAMAPTAVMGFSYLQAATGADGKPLFVGDIGDFLNWCVRFTLKFGFGLEFAILSGKPTIMDLIKRLEE